MVSTRTTLQHLRINAVDKLHVRLFLLQSAQLLFPSSFRSVLIVCWFCAARSAAAFGVALLDIIFWDVEKPKRGYGDSTASITVRAQKRRS